MSVCPSSTHLQCPASWETWFSVGCSASCDVFHRQTGNQQCTSTTSCWFPCMPPPLSPSPPAFHPSNPSSPHTSVLISSALSSLCFNFLPGHLLWTLHLSSGPLLLFLQMPFSPHHTSPFFSWHLFFSSLKATCLGNVWHISLLCLLLLPLHPNMSKSLSGCLVWRAEAAFYRSTSLRFTPSSRFCSSEPLPLTHLLISCFHFSDRFLCFSSFSRVQTLTGSSVLRHRFLLIGFF